MSPKKGKNASHAKIVNTANTVYNFKKHTEQAGAELCQAQLS